MPYPPVDVTGQWAKLNDSLIALVDYIPDDKLDWSPRDGLWNFRGILVHISMARHNWLTNAVKDGRETPDVLTQQTKATIKDNLQRSWQRVERFASNGAALDQVYEGEHPIDGAYSLTGHWIAFHLLEHDIHHRADLLHYLALLGIEHPEVGTP